MSTPDRAGRESELEPVEGLLREAAAWEPDAPAPEGLAARALTVELNRQSEAEERRKQQARVGLFGGLFLGASAVSASVALAFIRLAPAQPPTERGVSPRASRVEQPLSDAELERPERSTPGKSVAPAPAVSTTAALRNDRNRFLPRSRRSVAYSRPARDRRPTLTAAARAVEPPAAVWREERVRHEVAGMISTGWLLHQDPESGALVLSPGVLDLPALAQTTTATCESPEAVEMLEVPAQPEPVSSAPDAAAAERPSATGSGAAPPESAPVAEP